MTMLFKALACLCELTKKSMVDSNRYDYSLSSGYVTAVLIHWFTSVIISKMYTVYMFLIITLQNDDAPIKCCLISKPQNYLTLNVLILSWH